MSERDISRRSFMVRAITAVFGFIGIVMAFLLAGFGIGPVLKKREPAWSDVGTVFDLAENEPQERRFFETIKRGWKEERVERSLWLVKRPGGVINAFSPSCPHLGCGYRWVQKEARFVCPCHASVFDIDGKVLSGPAPRNLDTLETKVESGRVYVKFFVFQVGISSKKIA